MADSHSPLETFRAVLRSYEHAVEVGIGRRTDLAAELAADDLTVIATDVHERSVPDGVSFARDDIVDPELSIYEGADVLYARNLPPELHRPTLEVARAVDAAFVFTTLGGDRPTVPVERETIQEGTLYRCEPVR